MSNVFFISDLHLGHENVLRWSSRPWNDIDEMHEGLITSWNSVVHSKRDIVWVLGDVAFKIESLGILNEMMGNKKLILGNHDHFDWGVYRKYFSGVYAMKQKYGMIMTHIPIHPQEVRKVHRNWVVNIHGHIHDKFKDLNSPWYYNVNIDVNGYCPMVLDDLRRNIRIKQESLQ